MFGHSGIWAHEEIEDEKREGIDEGSFFFDDDRE
jgi:hypothetical protein